MRILVVGNGAREDALVWRLAQSESCDAIFSTPGNAGTAARGENWAIAATDSRKIVERAKAEKIDLVVLGPETAIAAGVGDKLREAGFAVFGPNRSGGRLESSKIFAKRFMERHGIPTARGRAVHSLDQALKVLEDWHGGVVIKADGLAAGKGVVVTDDVASARVVLRDWYDNKRIPGGGVDVLLEEKLIGREISVFAIADGRAMIPLAAACDYKRAGDGDTGPNTGGMGAYSPPLGFPPDYLDIVRKRVIAPALRGLLAEGETYIGILYCGLMWTANGPLVIEFNARFGDPETQVLMPRIGGDFARLLKSAADGAIEIDAAQFASDACVGVTLASVDYTLSDGSVAFWGGSKRAGDTVDASGGRVLTVCGRGPDHRIARERAYAAIEELKRQFPPGVKLAYRSDIALLDIPAPA
jgi:phosphoribosylamine--glycine ligase